VHSSVNRFIQTNSSRLVQKTDREFPTLLTSMKTLLTNQSLVVASVLALASLPTQAAFTTFFGEDINNSNTNPLATFPNASAAEASFLSQLIGVGTETFEGQLGSSPLALSFPGAGTATLNGGGGQIISLASENISNGFGRYGVTRDGGAENFWEISAGRAGDFTIAFSDPVAAFGFYGIDIGDFGGGLRLNLVGGGAQLVNVPNTQGSSGSTDGSVLFFGFVNNNPLETVTSIDFLTSTGQGDVFAFDDMTIGSIQQVRTPDGGGTLTLLGSAFAALTLVARGARRGNA
jgi:hypothetical protein